MEDTTLVTHTTHHSLSLFEPVRVDNSIHRSYDVDYAPACGSNVGRARQIQFDIPPSNDFIQLSECQLILKLQIHRVDAVSLDQVPAGTTSAESLATIATVNSQLGSLFKQCLIEWNYTPVSTCGSNFSYRSYIQHLLGYSGDQRNTLLRAAGYYEGQTNQDTSEVKDFATKASVMRLNHLVAGKGHEWIVCGRIPDPIFNLNKLLLSYVGMRIEFVREPDDFFLINLSKHAVYCSINEMLLRIRHVALTPTALDLINRKLTVQPARYVCPDYSTVYDYLIEANLSSKTITGALNNRIPKFITLGLVTHKAKAGTLTLNPFAFFNHNISEISVLVNGQVFPYKALKCAAWNFDNDGITMYNSINNEGSAHGIQYETYKQGNTFFFIRFEPINHTSNFWSAKKGEISINLHFSTPTTEALSLIVNASYSRVIEIAEDRFVTLNEYE